MKAKAFLSVPFIVFSVFAIFVALGYVAGIVLGVPSSFGFVFPIRLAGVLVLASGFGLLGWLFKSRKPVHILTSTYMTLVKAIGRVPLGDSEGRTESLVVRGPYKHVRHPLYLGVVSLIVGWWLLLDYAFLLLSAIFMFLWFNFVVAPFEERELRAMFGEEYEQYTNEVPRMIPFTKRKRSRKAKRPKSEEDSDDQS